MERPRTAATHRAMDSAADGFWYWGLVDHRRHLLFKEGQALGGCDAAILRLTGQAGQPLGALLKQSCGPNSLLCCFVHLFAVMRYISNQLVDGVAHETANGCHDLVGPE